jgi:hypothetical protein
VETTTATAVIIPQEATTPEEAAEAVMAEVAEALSAEVREVDEAVAVDKIFGGGFLWKALTKHLIHAGCFNRGIGMIHRPIPFANHYKV